MKNQPNYINHIIFVIDESGSMDGYESDVVTVFDNQIKFLAKRSQEVNQETRVSVFLFNSSYRCVIYDMDVMRTPSLASYYTNPDGSTALIDATINSIDDLLLTPEKYGDHAFLLYAITDGDENSSKRKSKDLQNKLASLKNNWTLAVLVPNDRGVKDAESFGFPKYNIQKWDVSKKGINAVGNVIQQSAANFMTARAKGIRSTNNLFNIDISKIDSVAVNSNLSELNAFNYMVASINSDVPIKTFVESNLKMPYVKGNGYYQLTKPETVQNYKQIYIQEKATGKVFGGNNARTILNLPNSNVKVNPTSYGAYDIFVQSTSVNRKLVKGTKLLLIK